jgi:hypothetical protein
LNQKENNTLIPDELITSKIYLIRNRKVMLDEDLAELYNVETRRLNEQVKRNKARFPMDFMFQLKSQFATSSWGDRRKLPYAFTEQGVAMLSGVLHSERAIKVNIQIMRVFTRMRELLETHKEILAKLDNLWIPETAGTPTAWSSKTQASWLQKKGWKLRIKEKDIPQRKEDVLLCRIFWTKFEPILSRISDACLCQKVKILFKLGKA